MNVKSHRQVLYGEKKVTTHARAKIFKYHSAGIMMNYGLTQFACNLILSLIKSDLSHDPMHMSDSLRRVSASCFFPEKKKKTSST